MNLSELAVELARKAHWPMGDAFRRVYAMSPVWLLVSMGMIVLAAAFAFRLRSHLNGVTRWAAAPFESSRHVGLVIATCALCAIALDGSGFFHGFFRQDDFSFLQVARDSSGVARQMFTYHNDHIYALFRIQVRALTVLAGPDASAPQLAAWFNLANFLGAVAMLSAGSWLLHELGASRGAVLAFPLVYWFWPGWGEFTAGLYTLAAYPQVIAASLAASASFVRGLRHDNRRWHFLSLCLASIAAVTDSSGLIVFPSLGLVVAACSWQIGDWRRTRWFWGPFAAILTGALILYFAAQHEFSNRELVQNPSGRLLGLRGLLLNLAAHPVESIGTALAIPGGLLLGFILPGFIAAGLERHVALATGLGGAQLVTSAALAALGWWAWKRIPARTRPVLLALAANTILSVGLVIAARISFATSVPLSLWPAKYVCIPLAWACLGALLIADQLFRVGAIPAGRIGMLAFSSVTLGVWLTLGYQSLEQAILPKPTAYVARGRWGNVLNARQRASSHESLLADLRGIARIQNSNRISLPHYQSWAHEFFAAHPWLEWGGDTGQTGVTHLFWDFLAAEPAAKLTGQFRPASEFSAELRANLTHYTWLRRAFAETPEPN